MREIVKKYLTTRSINNVDYCESICATSVEEAQAICDASGARLEGESLAVSVHISGKEVIDFVNSLPWDLNPEFIEEQVEAFINQPRGDNAEMY